MIMLRDRRLETELGEEPTELHSGTGRAGSQAGRSELHRNALGGRVDQGEQERLEGRVRMVASTNT